MAEDVDDHDVTEAPGLEFPAEGAGAELSFGAYSVLSPGVEIVLEGRPVSAPAAG